MALFWGCFIALITTAFAFITRAFLVNDPTLWPKAFGLDGVQAQQLFGAGIWPFAISIILFSLIIDRVGYKAAMWFSFICYALYAVLALQAHSVISADPTAKEKAYQFLYWGSVILGLGNGTVEAFINPVVATMFNKDKSKWLNILHAGWPGGLVVGGLITLMLGTKAHEDWRVLVYVIAIPALVYVVMLAKAKFPVNERVASGTTYREMLGEFGILGAAIASYLICAQLAEVFAWLLPSSGRSSPSPSSHSVSTANPSDAASCLSSASSCSPSPPPNWARTAPFPASWKNRWQPSVATASGC